MLGVVSDGTMYLDQSGRIVEACWQQLTQRFRSVSLDAFVVMPNHVHGIIVLNGDASPVPSLPAVVGAFKSDTARRINNIRGVRGIPVWQRSFHDQIIRDDRHLDDVRAYITANPANWPHDEEHPHANTQGIVKWGLVQ